MEIKRRNIFKTIEPYYETPEAIIITGMRRTGKTTTLRYIHENISSKNKLFIDLENPLNRQYFEESNFERIKSILINLGLDFSERVYLFIDEIQFVKNLPSVVKYFIDHYQTKFYLTGSASFYLKNHFTETLAGRKYIFHLYPLSFYEFLHFKNSTIRIPEQGDDIPQSLYTTISTEYEEYLEYGGFPGVVLKGSRDEKRRSLDDIFSSYFHLEVAELGDFRRNDIIRNLILLLMQRIGTKLDYQKISKELGVSRPTLMRYTSFLCDTFFINLVSPLSTGRDTEIRKAPKIYVCDCGLVNHFARLDAGHIFENGIFQSLLPKGEVHYYQRKSGVEIDFILKRQIAYEVKLNPTVNHYKQLGLRAKDLGLDRYFIVSKNYSYQEDILYGFQL